MLQIYHNPRCSKSRQGLQILKDAALDFEIIDYLKAPPTKETLKHLVSLLGIKPIDLVRKQEIDWKAHFKDKVLSDDAVIQAMIDFPKLMERPIVIHNDKAVVGRPPEIIKSIL